MNLLTPPPVPNVDEQLFIDSIKLYRVAETDALQAIKAHGLEGAIQIRDYVLQQVAVQKRKRSRVRDIGAYMARCFREGYGRKSQEDESSIYPAQQSMDLEPKIKTKNATDSNNLVVLDIRKEFREYQNGLVDKMLSEMSLEEREKFNERFANQNPVWARKFKELGLKTPMIRSAFYKFAADNLLAPIYKDMMIFARDKGVSEEIIQMLKAL